MRIISGNFKGKKLFLPKDKKTRPLRDAVKESIFNIIEHSKLVNIDIKNSNILDLYSGSGSFGIECLSRGAKKVTFVENYADAISVLKKNLKQFENFQLIEDDCFKVLEKNKLNNQKFDIIFIDPPFRDIKINEIINKIFYLKLLSNLRLLVIHRHIKDNIQLTENLNIIEERNFGISKIYFGN